MATSRAGARSQPPLAGYVLHAWDWSESSLILDVFTREQGRLAVAAKGAKKPTSNLRAVLLPFHALTLWLSRSNPEAVDEVRALRAAEWAGSAAMPVGALLPAFYLNELLLRGLGRQDPHPRLFDAYAGTLAALATATAATAATAVTAATAATALASNVGGVDEPAVLRAFELVFLRELGVLPELGLVTLTAEPLHAEGRYTIRPETGVTPAADGLAGAAWIGLEAALVHGSLDALRDRCRPVAAGLRAPLRALVHYHLGTTRLRTRDVWLETQRLAEPACP